ncbi:MAG: glycerol-3-phosphate 1-O-acyltransferase PlsY [Rickettsiales bacterium]|jgi:glycerol-3-phosphate acyltransferase PlsY|nr:glycerol-3-phosphate 1-O-acyltransferase PlsY [Rickettsiales bacterium]
MEKLYILIVVAAYLIGAIPFGYILAKWFAKTDLRKIGSGSTGATNALRAGGKWVALATLVLDAAKPVAAYFAAIAFARAMNGGIVLEIGLYLYDFELKVVVAALAVLAHCFPVYLGFKGGKGVATAWGTMWLFSPWLALASIGVWIVAITATRKSSLSALTAAAFVPLWARLFAPESFWLYVGMVLFVILRHASNIRRLMVGTESRVEFSKERDAGK